MAYTKTVQVSDETHGQLLALADKDERSIIQTVARLVKEKHNKTFGIRNVKALGKQRKR